MLYFEVSAKADAGVSAVFEAIVTKLNEGGDAGLRLVAPGSAYS